MRVSLLALLSALQLFLGAAAADCARADPLDADQDLAAYNGAWLAADGCFYAIERDPAALPPYEAAAGSERDRLLFYVPGANATPEQEQRKLTLLAERSRHPVIGVFLAFPSASPGPEVVAQAADRLAEALLAALAQDRDPYLQCGSLGCLVSSLALAKVERALRRDGGMGASRKGLGRIGVETMGGLGLMYVDGPRYVHYANLLDANVRRLGALSAVAQLGRGAIVAMFADTAPPLQEDLPPSVQHDLERHGFPVYNRHWQPFDTVQQAAGPRLLRRYLWLPRLTGEVEA